MPLIRYIEWNPKPETLKIVGHINDVIDEFMGDGYTLTVRQLYYQLVGQDLIPNNIKSYNRIKSYVTKGRHAGLIDWEAIVDRTRNLESNSHWDSPAGIIDACAKQFKLDLWEGQDWRPELWIEKDALAGIVEPICKKLDIPFMACKGYMSASEMWAAAQRLSDHIDDGQRPIIIHLGDHDPSGIHMTIDILERLALLSGNRRSAFASIKVDRIALNMDQVDEHSLPPNPAKQTDSRYATYADDFGDSSWELDALKPQVITKLATDAIDRYRDDVLWIERDAEQTAMRVRLQELADNWEN